MYILNIASSMKKIPVNEIRDYHERIGFSKENSYYSIKHQKNKVCNYLQSN